MQNLADTLKNAGALDIMVVGDLMLDTFVYGDVERISPESPVPVLAIGREERMLGGAGNVLANLCTLGMKPRVFAATGDDAAAEAVMAMARDLGADTKGMVRDASRPTTQKTRYVARGQHLLRTDIEKTHALSAGVEAALLELIEKAMKDVKAVILSDYGKGVLTAGLLAKTIAAAKAACVPVLVDPKGRDYSIYRGADYVTPNRKELAEATGAHNPKNDDEIVNAARALIAQSGIGCVIATRSEDGLSVVGKDTVMHVPTKAREVFDVSGAGDTVIATLAAMLAAGADIKAAATVANIAAGIAVSKVGTTQVGQAEIAEAMSGGAQTTVTGRQARLADEHNAMAQVRQWQAQGLKVGFTNGCFDIVHKGHVNYLEQARSHCDRLVLALNSDASVRLLKGPTRPINDEQSRATVMGSLSSVDLVVLFGAEKAGEDNTPCALIEKLRPDIFFKGGDYKIEQLPEAKIVQSYGGEVAIMGLEDGFSTTNIIAKSAQRAVGG